MRTASIRVQLEAPSMKRSEVFLQAVRKSRALHSRWAHPPTTAEQYREFVRHARKPSHIGHLVFTDGDSLAGVINISEIVRGSFCSGYLGYYAFAPHAGRGYMRAGLAEVLRLAFREYRLHRLEANIQPENHRSIALVRSLGFRCEGYSPGYLKIAGRWRDHERWALTSEDWKTIRRNV